jgi:hypothetical protein
MFHPLAIQVPFIHLDPWGQLVCDAPELWSIGLRRIQEDLIPGDLLRDQFLYLASEAVVPLILAANQSRVDPCYGLWSGQFWYGRDLIGATFQIPLSPTPDVLGTVFVSLTYDEILAMSPHADEFRPEPLPTPRPPTPPAVELEIVGLFDEDSDRPNPADPYSDPVDAYDPMFELVMEEAATFIDQSVADVPNWPLPTVMPLCLRPYAQFLVAHPLCPGYYKILGRVDKLMLGESRQVPGQIGVFADASFARQPGARPVSFTRRAVFEVDELVSEYEGVRYAGYHLYENAMAASLVDPTDNQFLWESDLYPYFVVDGRPLASGFCRTRLSSMRALRAIMFHWIGC